MTQLVGPRAPFSRRSRVAVCLFVVARLGLAAGLQAADGQASPEGEKREEPILGVDDPVYDWGKVYRGEQIEHTFVIENKGGAPLSIVDLKPGCGCTVLKDGQYKKLLAPGEKTSITLGLDTSGLSGFEKKETEIITNAAAGDGKLWFQGEVEELLKLEPDRPGVEIIRDCLVPPAPTTVKVRPNLGKVVRLLSVAPLKEVLTAELVEVERGKEYALKLLPAPKGKDTSAFQTESLGCKVELDGKTLDLRISVAVVLKPRIDVAPSKSVYFHRKETQDLEKPNATKITKNLEIVSLGGAPHTFKVLGVTVKNKVFETAIETITEGKAYRLKVTLVKAAEKGQRILSDTIEVTTDDPSVPKITIPAMAQF